MSRARLRLFRLNVSKNRLSCPCWNGGMYRPTSPPLLGSSTLMTSAPRSARCTEPNGPAPYCSIATTRTSWRGLTTPSRRDRGQDVAVVAGHSLPEGRWGRIAEESSAQHREDRSGDDREDHVAGGLDDRDVEPEVALEQVRPRGVLGADREARPEDGQMLLRPTDRGQTCGGDLEDLPGLQQMVDGQ